jgi:hypothetical protein
METVDSLDGPGRKQSLSFFPYRYISRPYPRNCQTLGVPRQSRGFTNLIMMPGNGLSGMGYHNNTSVVSHKQVELFLFVLRERGNVQPG